MRQITVLDDVRIRFPGRSAEFDDGIEIGVIATLMAVSEPLITRTLSPGCLHQLRPLAQRLGYRVLTQALEDAYEVRLERADQKPMLRLVR